MISGLLLPGISSPWSLIPGWEAKPKMKPALGRFLFAATLTFASQRLVCGK
jgi:hypothetical protein